MKKKKNRKLITKGDFVIRVGVQYYTENSNWTDTTVRFTECIKKAQVFPYKENAEDVGNHLLKDFNFTIKKLNDETN